jgi:hypothetical protein
MLDPSMEDPLEARAAVGFLTLAFVMTAWRRNSSNREGANNVMLWTLLTAISSGTFIISAVATAKGAKAGFGGYGLAIIIGLALAVSNAWALEQVGAVAHDRSKRTSEKLREWWLGTLYVSVAAWALVAAFLGLSLTSVAMRLIV